MIFLIIKLSSSHDHEAKHYTGGTAGKYCVYYRIQKSRSFPKYPTIQCDDLDVWRHFPPLAIIKRRKNPDYHMLIELVSERSNIDILVN